MNSFEIIDKLIVPGIITFDRIRNENESAENAIKNPVFHEDKASFYLPEIKRRELLLKTKELFTALENNKTLYSPAKLLTNEFLSITGYRALSGFFYPVLYSLGLMKFKRTFDKNIILEVSSSVFFSVPDANEKLISFIETLLLFDGLDPSLYTFTLNEAAGHVTEDLWEGVSLTYSREGIFEEEKKLEEEKKNRMLIEIGSLFDELI